MSQTFFLPAIASIFATRVSLAFSNLSCSPTSFPFSSPAWTAINLQCLVPSGVVIQTSSCPKKERLVLVFDTNIVYSKKLVTKKRKTQWLILVILQKQRKQNWLILTSSWTKTISARNFLCSSGTALTKSVKTNLVFSILTIVWRKPWPNYHEATQITLKTRT